jgi:hypothetical protein
VLGHNFRSRSEILGAAVRCVAHNERRSEKTLVAVPGPGRGVQVTGFGSDWQEAHWVARRVSEAIAGGTPGPEILVLARTGYAAQPVQAALARAGVPHRVLSSLGLYERGRGQGRAGLPQPAGQPGRWAGVSPSRAVTPPGHRPGHRDSGGVSRARGQHGRPDRGVSAGGRDSGDPLPRCASVWLSSVPGCSGSGPTCSRDARSGMSCCPR